MDFRKRLSRRPCGPECRQCVRYQVSVTAVTTRHHSAQQTDDAGIGPGRTGHCRGRASNLEKPVEEISRDIVPEFEDAGGTECEDNDTCRRTRLLRSAIL